MRACADPESFRAAPIGRYIVGSSYLVWCWDETLCGSMVWGRPDEAETRQLVRFYEIDLTAELAPTFDVVTDASRIESVSASAFGVLVPFLARRLAALTARMRRNAIVVPPGIPGAIIAGIYPLLGATTTWKPFHEAAPAFAWLDRPQASAAAAALTTLMHEIDRSPPIVRALRRHLAQHLRAPALDEVARALRLSPRSLQRQLARASTSLRVELDRVRIEEATRRLLDDELKLEVIALELGFASPSHFTARFRQLTGETPSEFRARRRASAAHSR